MIKNQKQTRGMAVKSKLKKQLINPPMLIWLAAVLLLSVFSNVAVSQEVGGTKTGYDTFKGVKYIIHPSRLKSGGPPKDGIPAIDNPEFVSVKSADRWIKDNELVMVLVYKGVRRVYPLQIMVWHEIVNDVVAGDPILITYCPLCGSGIAYERKVNGVVSEFGTTGKLYNSNLVMYDRNTGTYWNQIGGLAIIGERTGDKLTPLPVDTVLWKDWKKTYSDAQEPHSSQVLSQKTGYRRDYGRDPYGEYYEDSFLFFPVEHRDDRIHPKTPVYGLDINGSFKAYRAKDLDKYGKIDDTVDGIRIRLQKNDAGVVSVRNLKTGETMVKENNFWFSWYAFHPDTLLYAVP